MRIQCGHGGPRIRWEPAVPEDRGLLPGASEEGPGPRPIRDLGHTRRPFLCPPGEGQTPSGTVVAFSGPRAAVADRLVSVSSPWTAVASHLGTFFRPPCVCRRVVPARSEDLTLDLRARFPSPKGRVVSRRARMPMPSGSGSGPDRARPRTDPAAFCARGRVPACPDRPDGPDLLLLPAWQVSRRPEAPGPFPAGIRTGCGGSEDPPHHDDRRRRLRGIAKETGAGLRRSTEAWLPLGPPLPASCGTYGS